MKLRNDAHCPASLHEVIIDNAVHGKLRWKQCPTSLTWWKFWQLCLAVIVSCNLVAYRCWCFTKLKCSTAVCSFRLMKGPIALLPASVPHKCNISIVLYWVFLIDGEACDNSLSIYLNFHGRLAIWTCREYCAETLLHFHWSMYPIQQTFVMKRLPTAFLIAHLKYKLIYLTQRAFFIEKRE